MKSKQLTGLLLLAGLVCGTSVASAQTNPPPSVDLTLVHDSGWVRNVEAAGAPRVVASFPVYVEGATWIRLYFSEVTLSGREGQDGAFLRITSMLDGQQQRLNARHVEEWQRSTAYFNGDGVLIELVAYPDTPASRFVLATGTVGLPPQESQCGGQDDRVASNDPRVARLLPIGCTGWIIDDACGCFLTAGHCSSSPNVAQFNVPLSTAGGGLVNPSPDDQYALDTSSRQSNGGLGIGNDYAYLGYFPNSNTGLTPREAQQAAFVIVNPPAFQNGQVIRITGYGTDSGTANQTQQTHFGPRVNTALATEVEYQADTQGGNSGSPVIFESTGQAIGIHTHGGCSSTEGNHGTGINHSGLQAFLANPKGVCLKVCSVTGTTAFVNGSGANPSCLQSANTPIIGEAWLIEVDASGTPGATSTFVQGRRGGTSGTFLAIGELLLDLSSPFLFQNQVFGSGLNTHSINVPNKLELVGTQLTVQGGPVTGSSISQLCNGELVTIGCQ